VARHAVAPAVVRRLMASARRTDLLSLLSVLSVGANIGANIGARTLCTLPTTQTVCGVRGKALPRATVGTPRGRGALCWSRRCSRAERAGRGTPCPGRAGQASQVLQPL